jgi:multidrug resistance efflux pump
MADRSDADNDSSTPKKPDRVRRITMIVAGAAAILFVYGLLADRSTPMTSQASVQAYLVQVAPEVSGRVVEVTGGENVLLQAGTALFRIDPEPYEIAVVRAEAALESAGQSIGSSTAAVASAEAMLAEAIAKRNNTREQTARQLELVKKGIYAEARRDQVEAALKSAEATVAQMEAELEKARQTLGPKGEANPQIRDAMAALRQAQLDLTRTTVYAPSEGGIPNLELAVGQHLSAGKAAMSYLDLREIWVEAAFRENSLEHIVIGTPVEIVLDIRPGRVYSGRVKSIGYGVASGSTDAATGLPSLREPSGWVRPPQPMPVRIEFDEPRPKELRFGSQATVMAFTGNNFLMNGIGTLRMWISALLTYVQ